MADIKITEKLASIIKAERMKSGLSAKSLSESLNKSPSYISTLERKKIDFINEDMLSLIFSKINNSSDTELKEYMDNILAETFLEFKLDKDELKNQEWMLHLSLIVRKIPISKGIVEFISDSLKELEKTEFDLARKINSNTYLDNKDDLEENKLYVTPRGGWSYKFNIDKSIIEKILSEDIASINYITMLGIIYNIYLLKGEDNSVALEKAEQLLIKNKFLDLNQIVKARQQHLNKEINKIDPKSEYSFELPKYEEEFEESLETISGYIRQLRDMNISSAYRLVKTTESNLKSDSGFMNVIYSIPFGELFKELSKEEKQSFLTELSKLIDRTIKKIDPKKDKDDEYSF